ncbi:MAG: AIR synthase-related protein [bacterium]|nr:AIR synthase-related protein [bacterium]
MVTYEPVKPYKQTILELIRTTWETQYVSVRPGTYPVIQKKFSFPEVDHTDGIGTKGVYHWRAGTFRNAVLDSLAMNLNDLAVMRAVPYKLQDHLTVPKEDERVLEVMRALVAECQQRQIAITGGENSFQDTLDGMDLSITMSGFLRRERQNRFERGDVLIGMPSNGLHSNGFTKVRQVFGGEARPEFTEPTRIYHDAIMALDEHMDIHGMAHITGGAYTKLKELLPSGCGIRIHRDHSLRPQSIFFDLHRKGILDEDMYKTFNCGIGFIFSVSPDDAAKATDGSDLAVIGEIIADDNVIKIESFFSEREAVF